MTDQLISFKTAKLAKEKGFHEETQTMTVGENYPIISNPQEESPYDWNSRKGYSIPTQSLLQKWLREKWFIHIVIQVFHSTIGKEWTFSADVFYENGKIDRSGLTEDTYEEALEQGLIKALKLIP